MQNYKNTLQFVTIKLSETIFQEVVSGVEISKAEERSSFVNLIKRSSTKSLYLVWAFQEGHPMFR